MKELENVKILTHSGYWDGPLDGLCEYQDKIYKYNVSEWEECIVIDEDEDEYEYTQRIYNICEIEPWQLAYELYWHALFCTNVKANSDFDEKLVNDRFKLKKSNKRRKKFLKKLDPNDYYGKREKEYQEIDYSDNKIIGTFKN